MRDLTMDSRKAPWEDGLRVVGVVARKELRDAAVNRWLAVYALVFGLLAVGVSYLGYLEMGSTAFQGFGRTTASLLNLCLLMVPIVALIMGASSIAGERETGTLITQLGQPVGRTEFLLGKFLGQFGAVALATLAGFGLAGIVVAVLAPPEDISVYVLFVALVIALTLAMLSLGYFLSVVCGSRLRALLAAVFVWFAMALLMDLVAIGALAVAHLSEPLLWVMLLLNPVEIVRLLAIFTLEPDLYVLGPLGSFLRESVGTGTAVAVMGAALAAWAAIPLALACAVFRRQDV